MQLSKLEIKGFKSFGDKVTINFDEGITGIVGPNGCGKSNVVDSIRWVLGEQKTRALRSDKMENVIFNGTRNRKAAQMAEVSITFNNTKNLLPTEYTQVTITRRYYRTGESEYLLNGVTCRLKDINDLFLDTGIGPDSYAIIELKMVDDILNDKDNSRRNLFEEAAGISKFKIRKKQTLKKLEDTDADLARVEDLLFEIEKNLKSLERQAKQAEKYFELKEEYKKLSVLLARLTIDRVKQSFGSLEQNLQTENDRKLVLNKELAQKDADSEKLKAELIAKEKLLGSRQKAINEHINKIRQYESEKKIKNERLRYLNDRNQQVLEQLEQDRKSNERAEFSIKSLSEEKSVLAKLLAEQEASLEILKQEAEEQKLKTSSKQEEVNGLNNLFREKQENVFKLNKSLEIAQVQLTTLKQELEKTHTDSNSQTAGLADFEQKIGSLTGELNSKEAERNALVEKEEALLELTLNLEKDIESIKDRIAQNSRRLDARQNEFNLTKSLVDNLEGFPEAVKFLRKATGWAKNAPLLSDIITCDEKYRVAVENFLEPYMNYYVVENEAQAMAAVNLLSDSAKGKANFFILEKLKNVAKANNTQFPNTIPALSITEFDPKYSGLAATLLYNVYIITDNQESLPENAEATFITQNGKITKRQYAISGGSVGLFEGKRIGRAKNLEKLEKEISSLTGELVQIRQELTKKQNAHGEAKSSTKRVMIDALQKEIAQLSNELTSFQTRKEQFLIMLRDSTGKQDDLSERITQLTEEITEKAPLSQQEQKDLTEIEAKINDLNAELISQKEITEQRTEAFNKENITCYQQRNKLQSIEQEVEFKQSTFESSKVRIEKNREELQKVESEIKVLLETAEFNDDALVEMYQEKESIEGGVNEAEKDYYASRGQIDTFEKESREIQRQRENCDTLIFELNNQVNDAKMGLNSIKERLSVEFSVDIDDEAFATLEIPNLNESELRSSVDKSKASLERMGPINPMAMEAYNEISERHTFITTQKNDLAEAKSSLLQTISEIDTVAKETFEEAFVKIRENFIKVFRTLFTEEDTCDLKLTDPDNPTESPIEIIARPKGKRPLTINQLSGGEKTLTAISLLFSIYLLKPAPFCIFDEVDAPLDDANIDKFNNIIRKFSNESQFIIVTHNKRTMASTDVIYGVTMLELGVSRVVPVDLRQLA